MTHKLIVMIVKKGRANDVVAAAKGAGATGATISYARGTSIHSPAPFLGLQPTNEQELIHLLVPTELCSAVLRVMADEAELDRPGFGVGFVLTADSVVGLVHASPEGP